MDFDYLIDEKCCRIRFTRSVIENYVIKNLKKDILNVIRDNEPLCIIYNFQEVNFLDSSALGMFIKIQYDYKNIIEFRYCHFADNLRKAIAVTGLDAIFQIDETEEASIANYKNV